MILTSHEMLLYLSYNDGVAETLHLTPSRLRLLRHRISRRNVSEEYIIDSLQRLGCRCIRPRVVLPCIVQDKNGRKFDEYSFVKFFLTRELAEKYNADYDATIATVNRNNSINRPLFKHLLKSRRAWIILDNYVLDSVWSYEPIELTITGEKIKQMRSMLAGSVPFSDNPRDILTYRREHPVTWSPEKYSQSQDEESGCHSTTIQ